MTVVAPTRRVDVALPEDVPLAELLPDVLRLIGGGGAGGAPLSGYVLTGPGGVVLDTSSSLHEQGVLHGELLRLQPIGDLPEAAVHDDIVDAVAEAVLGGGRMWSAVALRVVALAVVGVTFGLGAVVLWFAGAAGGFHGRTSVVAGVIAVFLLALGVWRARYDMEAVGRGSYYGYADESQRSGVGRGGASGRLGFEPGRGTSDWAPAGAGHSTRAGLGIGRSPAGDVGNWDHRTWQRGDTASRIAGSRGAVSSALGRLPGSVERRDYTAAAVLTACSLPYAFIAGVGVLRTDDVSGVGRSHFTLGATFVLILALVAIVGLGRRVSAAVAGLTVGLIATVAGVGLMLAKTSPASGVAVTAGCCAAAIEALPLLAMYAARFIIEPPTTGVEPGEFDGSPVNNLAVAIRVVRTQEILTGLTAGVGTVLVLCVALLVVPITALGTAPRGPHTAWEQVLAALVSGVALCRARLFRQRAQVLALTLSGLVGLILVVAAVSAQAGPDTRATWLTSVLVLAGFLALGLATIRPRRGTTEAVMPPRWARTVDLVEGALFLGVLPVLLAVLGVYGQVRGLKN